MGTNCDKCGSSASLIFCWDFGRARECSATYQSFGAHIKTHMHSPVCDVCAVKPALIQCFSDSRSFCYTCFTGQHCVTSKDHLSVIPFSSHMSCSDAPNQQQLSVTDPSTFSDNLRSISTFSSLPQLRAAQSSRPSSSLGTLQTRPQKVDPFSTQQVEIVHSLTDLFSPSSRGTLQIRPQQTPST